MGDAGEGLIDADSRIQERRDELEQRKKDARLQAERDPKLAAEMESIRLARVELSRQLELTSNEHRRAVLAQALAQLDKRLADIQSKP